ASLLGSVYVEINNVNSFTGSCGARYDQATNQLFLVADSGLTFLGPITPGSAATLQNSQCVLNGATSSVGAAGNHLTVNYGMSFVPRFIGPKNTYLCARDTKHGADAGWVQVGTWSLPVPTPAAV